MSSVNTFELVLVLVAGAIGLEIVAQKLRLPPAAAFVAGGAALALVPGMPAVELDPDLVLVLFLPPLLMGSAYLTVWRDFRANLRIIGQLAIGAVVFTTVVVGVVLHWVVPELPWGACFTLGAIVSPPDAVSAKAVLARVRLPHRMVVLLEGESLVNDASGLVLYRFAVASTLTGTFSFADALLQFAAVSAGGIAIGTVVALFGMWAIIRLQDGRLSVAFSLLSAWTAYIGADRLGASGVLAAVTAGLIVGWRQHSAFTATMRTQGNIVWGLVSFVFESLIFILIGLSLHGVVERLSQSPGGVAASAAELLPATAAVVAATILSRFAWIIPTTYVSRFLLPGVRRRDPYPPIAVPVVLSWAGMRGVVSLAIALALPANFPGRDLILVVTFAVILVTVLLQGLTLAPLIRLLRVSGFELHGTSPMLSVNAARAEVAEAQLGAIKAASAGPDGERHPRLVEQFSYRARAVAAFAGAAEQHAQAKTDHFNTVLSAISAGREKVLAMHRSGQIHDSVLVALEQELDFEELNARRHMSEGE